MATSRAPVRRALPRPDLADILGVDTEEQRELCEPLVEQRLPVHEDERAATTFRDQVRAEHGLADAWRRDECTDFIRQEGAGGLPLDVGESALKAIAHGSPVLAFVLHVERNAMPTQEPLEFGPQPSRQGDVLWQVLGAADHAWRQSGRQSHALLLVELGVLERGQPFDLVEQWRRQAGLLHEQPLGKDRTNSRRQRPADRAVFGPAGGRAGPRSRLFVVERLDRTNPENRSLPRRLARDRFDSASVDPLHAGQVSPLLIVGVRLEVFVQEDRVPVLARPVLKGQRDQVAEAAAWHRVLAGEQTVVGVQAELVTAGHRLGDEIAAHLSGRRGGNGLVEEEPDVRSVARPRAFNGGLKADVPTRCDERRDVIDPGLLVEVDGQEPARLVFEQRIDAHDVLAAQVRQDGRVIDRHKGLVRTLAALDLRELANTPNELVRARGRVAWPACLLAHEPSRKDVLPATEELSEQRDLMLGRHGGRHRQGPREAHLNPCLGRVDRAQLGLQRRKVVAGLALLDRQVREPSLDGLDLGDQLVSS